jgi:hypothetical protein
VDHIQSSLKVNILAKCLTRRGLDRYLPLCYHALLIFEGIIIEQTFKSRVLIYSCKLPSVELFEYLVFIYILLILETWKLYIVAGNSVSQSTR